MNYTERRKQQSMDTEQAILQAAMELARAKSFDQVSVREICRLAGITTGAFYHHFHSKEELLSKGFAPLDSYMERALAQHENEPPEQRLWIILSTYADFLEQQGWKLVARYYQRRVASANVQTMDPTRFTHRVMLDCLKQADALGLMAPGYVPEWVAEFLFRHFRGVVIDWILHQGGYPLLAKLEQDYTLFRRLFQA